jgi:periplasmic protein TonB
MSTAVLSPTFFAKHRIAVIAGAVLMFHAMAIWALQSGLLMRAVEMVVPVAVLAQIIEPPKPVPPPPPPVVPKELPPPVKQTVVKPTPPVPQTQAPPQILAVETPTPAPNAPAPVQIAPPAPILPPSVPVAAVASPAPVPAPVAVPAKIEQVTVDGNYLSILKPKKSNLSIRMGEYGNAKIRVYVGIDGFPKRAEVVESSGFPRLDQLAKDAVMSAKYRSKRINGVPVEADFDIPFIFERD